MTFPDDQNDKVRDYLPTDWLFTAQVLLDHLTKDQLKVDDVNQFVNNGIAERFARDLIHRFGSTVRVDKNYTPQTDRHTLQLVVFTPEGFERYLRDRIDEAVDARLEALQK